MRDQSKTKQALIQELASLKKRITELEQSESERKRLDDVLRLDSEILANMKEGLALIRVDEGVIVYANTLFESMFGYDSGELVGKHVSIVNAPGEKPPEDVANEIIISLNQAGVWHGEVHNLRKDGTSFWCYAHVSTFKHPQYGEVWIAVHQDITVRKQAEEALQQSEEKYRSLCLYATLGIFHSTLEDRFIDVNPALARMMGYDSPEEAVSLITSISEQVYFKPLQRDAVAAKVLDAGGFLSVENHYRRRDGTPWHGMLHLRIVHDQQGRPSNYEGFVEDITERKKMEDALRESEERYRSLFENSLMGISQALPDGSLITANNAYAQMYGYANALEIMDEASNVGQRYANPGDREEVLRILKEKRFMEPREVDVIHRDGTRFTVLVGAREIRDSQGNLRYYQAEHIDITERKLAEEAVKKSEAKYRRLHESLMDGFAFVGMDGIIKEYNKSFLEMIGYTREEILKLTYRDITPEKWHSFEQNIVERQILTQGYSEVYEKEYYKKDGTIFPVELRTFLIKDETGSNIGMWAIVRDITERKKAEEALHESEEKHISLIANIPDIIFTIDLEGKITFVSQRTKEILGYENEETITMNMLNFIPEEDHQRAMENLQEGIKGKKIKHFQIPMIAKSGERLIFECSFSRVYKGGALVGVQGTAVDITERKQAEEIIKASLQEKDILLREIHHRVKNNLQVISGLLDLQAMSAGNPELMEKLNESQSRIQAMTIVHEKLYGSKDFSKIDLADYVRTLSQDLFKSYKITPGRIDLIIQTDGIVYVDINKAIPCGLILNELISNALKHAFPGDRQGELQIIIGETKNTEIEIVVRDDGVGLPDNVDIHQPGTVGLHLVNGLVKNQLDGQMEVRRDNGTEFRIKFP